MADVVSSLWSVLEGSRACCTLAAQVLLCSAVGSKALRGGGGALVQTDLRLRPQRVTTWPSCFGRTFLQGAVGLPTRACNVQQPPPCCVSLRNGNKSARTAWLWPSGQLSASRFEGWDAEGGLGVDMRPVGQRWAEDALGEGDT